MNKHLQKLVVAASSMPAFLQFASVVQAQTEINLLGEGQLNRPQGFASNLGVVLNSVLNFVLVIAALLVLFYLILGGIEWITSGGDKGKTEAARNKITSAVIGIIVLAASYAVFQLIIRFLGFNGNEDLFRVQTINQ